MNATATDLSPVINVLLQLAATVLLAAGTWGIGMIVRWLGLKNAAQATASLDDALQKSVTYGLQQTQTMIRQKGWDHAEVKSAALKQALPYMIQRFPDVLGAAGVDMSNQAALQTSVTGALDRAFPHAAAIAANSPATPPATAPSPPVTAGLASTPGGAAELATAIAA